MEELYCAHHAIAGIGDRIFVFGGLNQFHEATSDLFEISVSQSELYAVAKIEGPGFRPSPRYHAAMTAAGQALYVYGGTVNGRDGLDDFWVFENGEWGNVPDNGPVKPPAGFGLDLCFFPETDELLLAGGNERFVFFKFARKSRTWEEIATDIQIPPYVGLKVVRMQSGCGFLVGGHTLAGECNNSLIWFSSFGKHTKIVLCTGMPPNDRVWASYGRIGTFIFVVGGEDEFQDFVMDVDSQQWSLPRNSGVKNSCPPFYGAACFVLGNVMWIHGGFSDTNEVQSVLYRVTVTAKDAAPEALPELFSIQDCCKDDWIYNKMMNPASVKDEDWEEDTSITGRRKSMVVKGGK
jgi:hypothetical protein